MMSFTCPHCPPRFGFYAYCQKCDKYEPVLEEDMPELTTTVEVAHEKDPEN